MTSTTSRHRSGHPFGMSRTSGKHASADKRYHIEASIGEGATSTVYRAVDTLAGNRIVALKVLRYEIPTEWETLLQLQHTSIVQVRDVGNIRDPQNRSTIRPYIAMDLEPGAPLSADVREHRKLSDSLDIIKSCGRAIAYLHEKGIGHFDIKPSNIFIARSPLGHLNGAKILDFGLAAPLMRDGIVHDGGTFAYMSPEQIARRTVTDQSDVFSLAVVSYELLTGRHPFVPHDRTMDLGQLQEALAEEVPRFVCDHEPAVPVHVAQVVHKALAKQPEDRPSARQFVDLLDQNDPFEDDRQRLLHASAAPGIPSIEARRTAGDLDVASEELQTLERQGWAFPEIVLLRHQLDAARTDAAVEQRVARIGAALAAGDLEIARAQLNSHDPAAQRFDPRLLALEGRLELHERNRARAGAALLEAKSRLDHGALREAEWFTGVVRGIESFDAIAVRSLIEDLAATESATVSAEQAQRRWFAMRSRDTLPPPPHETLATQAVIHEHAAQQHLPTVRTLVELLDPAARQRVESLPDFSDRTGADTPDVVRIVVDHLRQKNAALQSLRERVARASGNGVPIAEALQAVDDLLWVEPSRALETQRSELADLFEARLIDETRDQLAEHLLALLSLGEWESVRTLARQLPKGNATRWSTALERGLETSAECLRQVARSRAALRECRPDEAIDALRAALNAGPDNRVLMLALAAALLDQAGRQQARHERGAAAQTRADAVALLNASGDSFVLADATRALSTRASESESAQAHRAGRPRTSRPASPAPASMAAAQSRSTQVIRKITAKIAEMFTARVAGLRGHAITMLVAAPALALFGVGIYMSVRATPSVRAVGAPPPVAPTEAVLTIDVMPASATIRIDDAVATDRRTRVTVGTHKVVLSAPGYESIAESVDATGGPIALSRVLMPLPTRIQFTSNVPPSDVRLDSDTFLDGSGIDGDGGAHSLTASLSPTDRVAVAFTPRIGAEPRIEKVDAVRHASLLVVSAFGDRIRVFSAKKIRVRLNDDVKGDAGSKGLSIARPSAVDAVLQLDDGHGAIQITVPRTESPLLQVHAAIPSDLGSIVVTANEDGSTVTVDGQPKGIVRQGRLVLRGLGPATYALKVSKPEFCASPDDISVPVTASGRAEAQFTLARPVIRLIDAPPGAKVLLDGRAVSAPGAEALPAGTYALSARASGYRDYATQVQVACGTDTTISLTSAMQRLGPQRATLVLNLAPKQTSTLLYRRGQGGQEQLIGAVQRSTLELEAGDYRLHLSAVGHEAKDVTVSLKAGQVATIAESLVQVEQTWSPPLLGLARGWQRANGLSVLGDAPASGTYSFRVLRQGLLTRRFFGTWIVGYRGPGDYVEFRVDDGRLQWRHGHSSDFQTIGELSTDARKLADERKSIYVRIHISGAMVGHEIGGDETTLSAVGAPVELQEGQFGLIKDSQIAEFGHS